MTNDVVNFNVPALPDDFNTDWASDYLEDEPAPSSNFLRFNGKTDRYTYGADATKKPCGTRLLALMDFVRKGYIKFNGPGALPDKAFCYAAKGKIDRNSLGDTDEESWKVDDYGKRVDPWQLYRELDVYDLATGEQYVFTAANDGSVRAVRDLVEYYQNNRHQHPGELLVIELQKSSYLNKKTHLDTPIPVLKPVGWQANAPEEAIEQPVDRSGLDDEIPF